LPALYGGALSSVNCKTRRETCGGICHIARDALEYIVRAAFGQLGYQLGGFQLFCPHFGHGDQRGSFIPWDFGYIRPIQVNNPMPELANLPKDECRKLWRQTFGRHCEHDGRHG